LLDEDDGAMADGYPYVHLVRGTLLDELGRHEAAIASLEHAAAAARNAHEARQIDERIARIRERGRHEL
jgi:predicted RNA polymerase sigma factor